MPPVTYEPIATTTLGSATNTVTFTGISGNYTDLILVATGTTTSTFAPLNLRVGNGSIDTASNYSTTRLYGNGTSAISDRQSTQTLLYTAGDFRESTQIFHFMNYSNTTTNKTVIYRTETPSGFTAAIVGLWRSTSAINQIQVYVSTNNFAAGAIFTLYGIKSF